MTFSEQSDDYQSEEVEVYCESEGSDPEYDPSRDPSYGILGETHAKFSNLSIEKKKSKARIVEYLDLDIEGDSDELDVVVPELDEKDAKSFEKVQKIIEAGQLEKLKVDRCKVYLRKNGLRLTGNKGTLIQRIKEHLEILNGGGEKKYPVSSFVLDCKGDACTGDVVMFEQNVYEMFNIASRSACGPPCGTRIVVGRIVKESYGAAKQQHTFTIEVLWSKGEKPLPPLHPLLIKGRNLYRLKTLRQRWENEWERQKALMEKHSRGSVARSDREVRVQKKENRKMLKATRISRQESNGNQSHFNSNVTVKSAFQPPQSGKPAASQQQFGVCIDPEKLATRYQKVGIFTDLGKPTMQAQQAGLYSEARQTVTQPQQQTNTRQSNYNQQPSQNSVDCRYSSNTEKMYSGGREVHHSNFKRPNLNSYLNDHQATSNKYPNNDRTSGLSDRGYNRQPLTSISHFPPMNQPQRQGYRPPQLCRYYAQGRCHFGDNCKFVHQSRR
ncbi:hypothetical protein F2P56_016271 [Juglans regia]|uniref:Zinc finger CCCH domain-containing protein 62-like n=2 Tax=Juglans regia TaxID=51240 RepID=A0A834CWA7_JUGRE|nr:zinc finger CCCH domain-containing protein 62 isoform X2 [Juglans regia]KAF5466338.1 hypothetical protein F2P56_016271 [Juglans regia]